MHSKVLDFLIHLIRTLTHINAAGTISLAVCIAMTAVQTYAASIKLTEQHPGRAGDADHLCIIQSAVMQYVGLYLRFTRRGRKNRSTRSMKPVFLWVLVNLVCPLLGIIVYPSHNYLSPFFLFLSTVAGSLTDLYRLEVQVDGAQVQESDIQLPVLGGV